MKRPTRIPWTSDSRRTTHDSYVTVHKVFKLHRGSFVTFHVHRQLVIEYVEYYFARWEHVLGTDWDSHGLGLMEQELDYKIARFSEKFTH